MMDRLLEKNYFVALLSLLLAVLVWAQVAGVGAAQPHRTLSGVRVAAQGLDPGMYLLGLSPSQVAVTVRGTPQQLAVLNPGAVRASVDLHGAKPGLNSVAVQVSLPAGVSLVGLNPAAVTARVDVLQSHTVPVRTKLEGDLAPGYQDLQVAPQPASVQVSGPAGRVERVAAVQVTVNQKGLAGTFRIHAAAVAVDGAGAPVSGVRLDPGTVAVRVQVGALPAVTLPVRPTVVGSPAAGYRAGTATANPASVTLRGPPAALRNLNYLGTQPVSVAGATATVKATVAVELPSGTAAVGSSTVQVTVPVTAKTGG
ncbi:MAG: CdaR family protein [Thermaerobacter sp.]|jgi:YbbR domain-containing protein|nr:CdaR family protein [Thermaerobacter sp.]